MATDLSYPKKSNQKSPVFKKRLKPLRKRGILHLVIHLLYNFKDNGIFHDKGFIMSEEYNAIRWGYNLHFDIALIWVDNFSDNLAETDIIPFVF